ncbi:unnamed protein product [Adineta ricciae]|uniref:Uncharacterized protein n=1 Tax=Adineta ricciae TaxID=249248 RepID=A0A813UDZ4_ADIRI|nr:unnamed protein product [Adineta ricciae]
MCPRVLALFHTVDSYLYLWRKCLDIIASSQQYQVQIFNENTDVYKTIHDSEVFVVVDEIIHDEWLDFRHQITNQQQLKKHLRKRQQQQPIWINRLKTTFSKRTSIKTGQLKHSTSNSETLLITMNTNQQFTSNATSITGTITNRIEIFIPSIYRLYEHIYHNIR